MNEHLVTLAKTVSVLNKERLMIAGQITVLTSAMHALVRTHPSPEAFAKEFRSAWLAIGQWHADGDQDPALLRGIDEVLRVVENACAVPLKVRPPREDVS